MDITGLKVLNQTLFLKNENVKVAKLNVSKSINTFEITGVFLPDIPVNFIMK